MALPINHGTLLSGVALNAAAADRTATLSLKRRVNKLLVWVFLTARSAATTLVVTTTGSADGTNYAPRQQRSTTSGGYTLDDANVDTKTVSAADEMYLEFDVRGLDSIKLVVSGASGGAGDLFNLQAVSVVEGD